MIERPLYLWMSILFCTLIDVFAAGWNMGRGSTLSATLCWLCAVGCVYLLYCATEAAIVDFGAFVIGHVREHGFPPE